MSQLALVANTLACVLPHAALFDKTLKYVPVHFALLGKTVLYVLVKLVISSPVNLTSLSVKSSPIFTDPSTLRSPSMMSYPLSSLTLISMTSTKLLSAVMLVNTAVVPLK